MDTLLIIAVAIFAVLIVVWTIRKNNREKKKYEDFLNREYKNDEQDEVNDRR